MRCFLRGQSALRLRCRKTKKKQDCSPPFLGRRHQGLWFSLKYSGYTTEASLWQHRSALDGATGKHIRRGWQQPKQNIKKTSRFPKLGFGSCSFLVGSPAATGTLPCSSLCLSYVVHDTSPVNSTPHASRTVPSMSSTAPPLKRTTAMFLQSAKNLTSVKKPTKTQHGCQ